MTNGRSSSLKRHLKIMFMLLKMKLARNMAFRLSFFGVFFVDGVFFLLQLLMFTSIYSQVDTIGDWGREQMLFFIGTFSLINALNMTVYFFGITTIPWKIKSGQLDLYITKPVNPLFHLSFENIDPGSVPLAFASIGVLGYAVSGMELDITASMVMGYGALVLLMTVLYYDMMVIIRTIPFFVIQANSLERLEGELLNLCFKIPGNLFKGFFKVLFQLVLPYGIMATVPTRFFWSTISMAGIAYSIVVVMAFTGLTFAFWRLGLRNYKSASS